MSASHRIEIACKDPKYDSEGKCILEDMHHYGLNNVTAVRSVKVYTFGNLDKAETELLAREFLADAVVDNFTIDTPVIPEEDHLGLEITRKPGVMDPGEQSICKGIKYLQAKPKWLRRSRKYLFWGKVNKEEIKQAAAKLLANELIEDIWAGSDAESKPPIEITFKGSRLEVPIAELNDEELVLLSEQKQLYLSKEEMLCLKEHFAGLERAPTDIELETLAQTWSEHCVHKTLKGKVRYNGPEGEELIDNLLANTIAKVTHELNKDWCLSVFKDNAGVIEFDQEYGAVFKVETHNHPSALEPYGGAGTGIGGVIRDCLGTGLGAKPIMNTDIFAFGPPDYEAEKLPKGALHPLRVMKGVVSGVRDYGNRMGIPTANGAVYFDKRYIGNPLVFAGTVGIIPRSMVEKKITAGQKVIVVGGKTGRDGIHGATFSSVELHEDSETISSGAVQIGNPIEEKKVRDFMLRARDAGLYTSTTDCGAGGLSSAVGEMGEELGVEVELEKIPLKYQGLSYTEIWISEAQERMVLAADPDKISQLTVLAEEEDVSMTVIGTFTGDKQLRLRYQNEVVGEISMDFLYNGVPRIERDAIWEKPQTTEPQLPEKENYNEELKKILGAWNVCSKEWIIRQYDHEVQAGSVIKPLVGIKNDGPSDGAVIAPLFESKKGLALAVGLNPKYSDLDPYWMAASAIDEALRNIIAVGGSLKRCAILDNYCWGNCNKPDRLGGLVRASKACYDIGIAYGVPFISGKDSLNNEFATTQGTVAIPGTLLISAMAVMENIDKAISMDLKEVGNQIFIIGNTYNELGASHFYELFSEIGSNVPQVRTEAGLKNFNALSQATASGLVRSLHDLSEGGLAVAMAEMAFAGGLGVELELAEAPQPEAKELTAPSLLFSESNSRFLAEIKPECVENFTALLSAAGVAFACLGESNKTGMVALKHKGKLIINEHLDRLKASWQKPLAL